MNAPPFPLNPNVGDWSGNWVWNGARWVASPTTGLRVVRQVFTASGPYMPSPGLVSCDVECLGGGGGGGSAGPVPNTNWILAGGGGGSGGYSKRVLPAALVRGGVMVTVGDGGAPGGQGAASGEIVSGTGGQGGTTSFGALCLANGGGGGNGNNANTAPAPNNGNPGNGADVGIGDVAWPGAPGFAGTFMVASGDANQTVSGGRGGWIGYGGGPGEGGEWNGQSANGQSAAPNTGAGGSGSIISQVGGGPLEGGGGGSGICIVTETVVGDRDQPVTEWRPPLDVNVTMRPPKPPWPGGPPGPPPWPGGGPWPPGAWWPPGWGPGQPWPPGWGPQPREAIEGREFEAGQPYDQSINPETGLPWEDDT